MKQNPVFKPIGPFPTEDKADRIACAKKINCLVTPVTVENDGGLSMSGECIPRPGIWARDSSPIKKRVQCFQGREYITMNSYSSASLWDGQPKYCSWYG